ncbi:MAG: glutamate--tRNA ligase [Candidatus Diapherotrites archaeon]|uniref:Glutamate--tRNA ligase n=1 Tax=Candidatus Iainarchaeum sp. TaxID=3101447 RepID=A0A7J4ISC5_9ARCH|nr:MAG: glutamyl-tRNA synthetase [archaeon GW2011_AR10]MBS3059572.1 glutamate--tRNA ligase [Candidatus Diapherotrites archaeon]HIH08362.1 glutamate--tRNA ligase [Candidatus Diapherotrites archaeon]
MEIEKTAYRYAIKNAFLHGGKADIAAVIGKVVALHKDVELRKALPSIQAMVKKVNSMPLDEIAEEYKKFEGSYELKPPEKKEGLPDLEWAEKEGVITRFAPNPNGPFHLGSARAAILSHEYARKYGGKFLLRFDDTDPKVKKPIQNAKVIFLEDLEWLGCSVDEIYFASDRLETYYAFMRKVIEDEKAYVCTCEVEKWRSLTRQKKACPCRKKKPEKQMQLFEKMLSNELKEGNAVLRLKTDLNHADPSVRDWWIAKIVDKPEHPNTNAAGKHVWPSYNFASAIDDHEFGVTLIIRGQEHEQNQTRQEFLYNYFGWKYPHSIHFGRVSFEGAVLSTSMIKEGIEKGLFTGWDDPRLGTIRAFRRRGFKPEAIKQIIMEIGPKTADTTIEFNKLADINRELVQDKTARLEFIVDPIRLGVNYAPEKEVGEVLLSQGQQSFLVPKKEIEKRLEREVFTLKMAYNVRLTEKHDLDAQAEFVGEGKIDKAIVAWLVDGITVEVLMPDASTVFGLTESSYGFKDGEIVYFERLGFCRIEKVTERGSIKAVFAHK